MKFSSELMLVLAFTASLSASASASSLVSAEVMVSLDATGKKLIWQENDSGNENKVCSLPVKAQKAQLSHDRSAVILSDVQFVESATLRTCGSKAVNVRKVASNVGFLVDVNVSRRLYLTLDLINTTPMSFLATVSKFNSSHNLVRLPGAYIEGRSVSKLREQGFAYNPETDPPRISRSGRYVSPGGAPDCSENAYPGVWDIIKNKKVVLEGARHEQQASCEELFR